MPDEIIPQDALVTMVVRFHAITRVIAAAELLMEERGYAGPPVLIDSIQHLMTALYANCYDAEDSRPAGPIFNPDVDPDVKA